MYVLKKYVNSDCRLAGEDWNIFALYVFFYSPHFCISEAFSTPTLINLYYF